MALSSLESLPTELLDQILSFIPSAPPPSLQNLRQLPNYNITSCPIRDLKNLSQVSARLNELARAFLFSHAQYDLGNQEKFIQFLKRHGLEIYVKTVTVSVGEGYQGDQGRKWWARLLEEVEPESITVIAPPDIIADMAGCSLQGAHTWAFDIPLQTISFRRVLAGRADTDRPPDDAGLDSREQKIIFNARPWAEVFFNESSSLKAYSTYEYYLLRAPSFLDQWGTPSSTFQHGIYPLLPIPALARLTSFHYTAIFPFYNHMHHVLKVIDRMVNLRHLSVQLAPGSESTILSEQTRTTRLNPNDPWSELETGYSLIAHTVRYLGRRGSNGGSGTPSGIPSAGRLEEFRTWDFGIKALREGLETLLKGVLVRGWEHDGNGLWVKREVEEASDFEEL